MKTWVKILLASLIIFIGVIGIIGLAFPEHLPALRVTLNSFFGGIYSGMHGFFNNLWISMEPVVMPNLFLFWIGSLIAFGVFMMYFGHKITTRMQNFIGIQWRQQANKMSGGSVPLTIGGGNQNPSLAAGTPSATALLGTSEPEKQQQGS